MHVDDLPDGLTAEKTATVRMTVEYVVPLTEDGHPDFGPKNPASLYDRQRWFQENALDVDATSLGWKPNRECAHGHVMPAQKVCRIKSSPNYNRIVDTDPENDCEECISGWERAYEARYSQ